MKKLIFLLISSLFALNNYAQNAVTKQWDARFGGIGLDVMHAVQQTNDGEYILGGYSYSDISGNKTQHSQGGADYWIVKIDAQGQYVWNKRFGGPNDDAFTSLYLTRDGGYILGGFSLSDIGGDKTQASRGGYDYWVVKLDSSGNKQWDKRFGGSGDDILDKVIQTNEGGYILAGFSSSGIGGDKTQPNWASSGPTADYWVVKIDSVGNKLWDKRFGGTEDETCRDIIQTPDGGYLLGGSSASDSSGDKTQDNFGSQQNFWVVKVDSLGNKQWDKVFGGTDDQTFGNSLCIFGGYMLGGTSYSAVSGDKTALICGYWIVKIDSSGNKLGDWAYGSGLGTGTGMCGETFGSISNASNGGYLLTGIAGSAYTVKIDSQMNKIWDKTSLTFTQSTEYSAGALENSNGCYVIGVGTNAGIGGDKTQAAWDSSFDYWVVEYCDTTISGITETAGDIHFSIYPNPTTREVSIMLQKDCLKEAYFTLINTAGQVIYQSDETNLASTYTKILDLGTLPSGLYLLNISVDGEKITRKILKE